MVITRSQSRLGASLTRIRNEIERRRRWRKRYKPTDVSHRHRLSDRQPKSVRVVSYNRRN
jgi:hypothetical protein